MLKRGKTLETKQQTVLEMWKPPRQGAVAKMHNVSLTYANLACLLPGELLNDQVINTVVDLLQWQTKTTLISLSFTWTKFKKMADKLSADTRTPKDHIDMMERIIQSRLTKFGVHNCYTSPLTVMSSVILCS